MIVFAREPIFDHKQQLFAYQLVFRDGEEGALPEKLPNMALEMAQKPELEAPDPIASASIGLEDLLSGFVSLISVTRQSLMHGLPTDFSPEDTILELPEISQDDTELIDAVKNLRKQGYRISIQHDSSLNAINFELANYVKINIDHVSLQSVKQLQEDMLKHNIQTIATNVQNPMQYQQCVDAGFNYFQGYFFLTRPHKMQKEIPANKLSLLNLLAQTADRNIDMDKIRTTFEHDATLSYLLMRFINNPMVNKSHKITSIKHALTYLGELMLRKFAAIVSIAQLNQDNVQELLQVSLVRAKYCELINAEITDPQDAMSAFMAGLFSLIDVILDREMAVLLEQITLSTNINKALLEQTGPYYPILSSIKSLESSNWLPFKANARTLNIDEETLHKHYLEAVKWNNLLHQNQSEMFPLAKP